MRTHDISKSSEDNKSHCVYRAGTSGRAHVRVPTALISHHGFDLGTQIGDDVHEGRVAYVWVYAYNVHPDDGHAVVLLEDVPMTTATSPGDPTTDWIEVSPFAPCNDEQRIPSIHEAVPPRMRADAFENNFALLLPHAEGVAQCEWQAKQQWKQVSARVPPYDRRKSDVQNP
jgi:hypothetical protein